MATKCVLVVEDDRDIRTALKTLLEQEGFRVLEAGHGREALDLLKDIPCPDLIILDLMMPVMDGWEFVMAMHLDERLTTIPVVLVTACAEPVQGIGSNDIVRKPINLTRLLSLVRHHCQL